jgi:hypothetical protein
VSRTSTARRTSGLLSCGLCVFVPRCLTAAHGSAAVGETNGHGLAARPLAAHRRCVRPSVSSLVLREKQEQQQQQTGGGSSVAEGRETWPGDQTPYLHCAAQPQWPPLGEAALACQLTDWSFGKIVNSGREASCVNTETDKGTCRVWLLHRFIYRTLIGPLISNLPILTICSIEIQAKDSCVR